MIIADFTEPELKYLRENCNFVGNEKEIFELRAQDIKIERIAYYTGLTVSGVKYINRKINSKIKRVL